MKANGRLVLVLAIVVLLSMISLDANVALAEFPRCPPAC